MAQHNRSPSWHLLKQIFKANFLRKKCPSSLKFIAVSITEGRHTLALSVTLVCKVLLSFLLDSQVDAVMCRCCISLCSLTGSFWQKNWWTPGKFILPELWVCSLGYSFFCSSVSTCLSVCLPVSQSVRLSLSVSPTVVSGRLVLSLISSLAET